MWLTCLVSSSKSRIAWAFKSSPSALEIKKQPINSPVYERVSTAGAAGWLLTWIRWDARHAQSDYARSSPAYLERYPSSWRARRASHWYLEYGNEWKRRCFMKMFKLFHTSRITNHISWADCWWSRSIASWDPFPRCSNPAVWWETGAEPCVWTRPMVPWWERETQTDSSCAAVDGGGMVLARCSFLPQLPTYFFAKRTTNKTTTLC